MQRGAYTSRRNRRCNKNAFVKYRVVPNERLERPTLCSQSRGAAESAAHEQIYVQGFKKDISRKSGEGFNRQFRANAKPNRASCLKYVGKRGALFVFFLKSVRSHSALRGLAAARVAA